MKNEILTEKLKMFAAAQKNDESGIAISSFLSVFLENGHLDNRLAEYLYQSDFFGILTAECIEKAKGFLNANADAEWFMLMEHIYTECKKPEQYFNVIERAFYSGIGVKSVWELLEDSKTAEDFEKSLKSISEKQDVVNKKTAPGMQDNPALIEQLQKEMLVYRRKIEELEREQAEDIFSRKIVNGKIRQYKEQVIALKSVNQMICEKNRKLNEEFTAAEKKIATQAARIAELEHISETSKQCIKKQEEQIDRLLSEIDERKKEGVDKTVYREVVPDDADAAWHGESDEEKNILTDDRNELIQIKDNLSEIKEHSAIFSKVFAGFYEKQFRKKPVSEQENLLFIKMMKLHFDKQKVLLVKKIMQENLSFSRYDLYKFISLNPEIEELEAYCNACAV